MIDPLLTAPQTRLLGCLIEKQITVPMSYPMTPNGVRVGCNQKNNRDPVVAYDDDLVFDTLKSLERLGYVESGLLDNTQTIKYRHRLTQALGLEKGELVILCELFNRGSQTVGELRSRCDRMHGFVDLADVERCLGQLKSRKFAVLLERLPGTKEPRWGHLFCGQPAAAVVTAPAPARSGLEERVASLEGLVHDLQTRLEALERAER
jgi:uncharacterized protein YceH (UPF0502 family)